MKLLDIYDEYLINDMFELVDLFNFNYEFPQWLETIWREANHIFGIKMPFRYI